MYIECVNKEKRSAFTFRILFREGQYRFLFILLFISSAGLGSKDNRRGTPLFVLWRCILIATKETQINEQIRDAEVRVIGVDGNQLGIMSAREAQKLADDLELDLVKIAPGANPPVCRIMDYGKYRFEQAKKEKEARKNQKIVEVKEVRLGLNIDIADFQTKLRHAIRFLEGGDKVKVSIRFKGRQMGHPELGSETMSRFADAIAEYAVIEKPAKMEGRQMLMFLAPKPAK